jgi:hypothetical protein
MTTTTITYKEVFNLAERKGYDSIICCMARYGGSAALPHSVTDDAGELCELALMQNWLRNEHEKEIRVQSCGFAHNYIFKIYQLGQDKCLLFCSNATETYKQSLIEGINEALKLL